MLRISTESFVLYSVVLPLLGFAVGWVIFGLRKPKQKPDDEWLTNPDWWKE